jgi:hypothetical protein
MRLEVINVNDRITDDCDWIYKLTDGKSDYYIVSGKFFYNKVLNIPNPISRMELDTWDIGTSVMCTIIEHEGRNIVTKINYY